MAWRPTAAAMGGGMNTPPAGKTGNRSAASQSTPRTKPTMAAIAEIEKKREKRRRAMEAAKRERKRESLLNEKEGHPGDVDFQRMIKSFREQNVNKKQGHDPPGDMKITICVRKRPVSDKEVKKRDFDAVSCLNPMAVVHDCKLKVDGITKYLDNNTFSFDHTFDENDNTNLVYKYTAQPLIKFVFRDGGRATVFAYGQTGSGKTFTMQGIQKAIASDVFAQLEAYEKRGAALEVWVSFFEIYGGRCQDLLHRKKLTIREDGSGEVQVVDLEEVQPQSKEELLQLMNKGNSLRTTHATEVNDVSSRSHSICQISIRERGSGQLHGKLSLIDLAGSERGEDTKNHNRQRRMESSEINKSLLALKECFRALDSGGRGAHIPFRASKLTQVLKDSFVNAKARTVMIAAVSPCASSADHTVNTLRYADRVKEKQVQANVFEGDGEPNSVVDLGDVQLEEPTKFEEEGYEDMEEELDASYDSRNMSDDPMSPDSEEAYERRYSNDFTDQSVEYSAEALSGTMQTLFDEQEHLLTNHMTAIQESAELLTEEGSLLAAVQGEEDMECDMDQYLGRLDEILMQKQETIDILSGQLHAFRQRWEEEGGGSSRANQRP